MADPEPLVTFPDDGTPTEEKQIILKNPQAVLPSNEQNLFNETRDTMKFEEKRMSSASKTKVITDSFSSESVSSILMFLFSIFLTEISYFRLFDYDMARFVEISWNGCHAYEGLRGKPKKIYGGAHIFNLAFYLNVSYIDIYLYICLRINKFRYNLWRVHTI